ncbi:uncharacterized protein LOC117327394 [Pecten maximus]|uniref:uncharacterized protein LOC117327394 n=1 Tax=Pecten maximus TaxID=6579 RepID=UPI0014586315|nr:uncharacterized protein LOC117327394 [Pecten maximus]
MDDLHVYSKAVSIFMEKATKMILRQKLINYAIKTIGGIPMFISGSRAECTQGLDSDTDIVYESPTIKATVNTKQARSLQFVSESAENYDAVVVMDTLGTHSGYTKVKLFDVNKNQSQSKIDVESLCFDDTEYVSSVQVSKYWEHQLATSAIFPVHGMRKEFQSHGPCIAFKYGGLRQVYDIDTLFSLPCDWPETAREWQMRPREYNWPGQETISKIVSMGCNLVPIGHADSSEKDLEWRISFNKTERELIWSFNGTQYACIDCMKIFFHSKMSKKFPDVFPSYFIKTIMLWMVEESPAEMWRPENLNRCLDQLLNRIIICLEKKEVRNYFIPLNNMIDTRSEKDLDNLRLELKTYKELGSDLWINIMRLRVDEADDNDIYFHHVEINSLCFIRHFTLNLLHASNQNTFSADVKRISDQLQHAVDLGLSENTCLILQQELGTILALHNFKKALISGEDHKTDGNAVQLLLQNQADVTFCCGRLMFATFHLQQGRYKEAQDIANDVIRGYVTTIVHYSFHNRDKTPKDEDYAEMYCKKGSTFPETLKRFIAFDIVCLPILIQFYPKAVRRVMQKNTMVLFINPLFYAHVINIHCCVETRNNLRAPEIADDLISFMEKNSKNLEQTSDTPIRDIAGECLKMLGMFDEARAYFTNQSEAVEPCDHGVCKRSRDEDTPSPRIAKVKTTCKAGRVN